jgi:hypothetical protein
MTGRHRRLLLAIAPALYPAAVFAALLDFRATAGVLAGSALLVLAVAIYLRFVRPRRDRSAGGRTPRGLHRSPRPGPAGPPDDRKVPTMSALPTPAGMPATRPQVCREAVPPT